MIKLPKWLVVSTVVILSILGLAFVAFGWFASSKILNVNLQKVDYDQTVKAISENNYTFQGSTFDGDGVFGGYRSDKSFIGIFSRPSNINRVDSTSVRQPNARPQPELKIGDTISLQGNIWLSDPKTALGLDFENVTYESALGPMNAWLVRSSGSNTWTIGVHGIGAPKHEMLRFVKPVVNSGNNMLVINYRNDEANPSSPDKLNHLGGTEWQDLEAAVSYAKSKGATTINLYGVSLGGSIVENYLRHSSDQAARDIDKVVLDSPALDWKEILVYRIKKDGFPGLGYYPTAAMMKLRGVGVQYITTEPSDIKHKTLLIHNADDKTVPQAASKRLAEARPDLVTFVDFTTGGHTRAWNRDTNRYEQLVVDFLSTN